MTVWRARAGVLLVFLLGGVCGGAGTHLYRLQVENRIARAPDPLAQLLVYRLDREVGLTDEQEVRVRRILHGLRTEVLSKQKGLMPEARELFDRGSAQVREVLTDEQRARFDELVAERRRLLEEMERDAPSVQ